MLAGVRLNWMVGRLAGEVKLVEGGSNCTSHLKPVFSTANLAHNGRVPI